MMNQFVGVLLLLSISTPAVSSISFTTDTSNTLIGSFSLTGYVANTNTTPGTFDLSPGSLDACNDLLSYRDSRLGFGTECGFSPDNAFFFLTPIPATNASFAEMAGAYEDLGTWTYFNFWNLADTGGSDGTFSGSFCFSREASGCTRNVPEPGTLALFGLGLAGLGLTRRRKAD